MRDCRSLLEVSACRISQGTRNPASEGVLYISVLMIVPFSSVMSTWGPRRVLSTHVCVLVDGETVVAAVEVVVIEVDDVVVDSDVVELFEMVDCEDTEIFFLALLDCV